MSIINKILRNIPPKSFGSFLACLKILEVDYGHFRSTFKNAAIDKKNNPIPWYTYPAIEYLKQLNFSQKTVFEYGSGNSSLFWASISKSVISIEDNEGWYGKVSKNNNCKNLTIHLIRDEELYLQHILSYQEDFDVIIIDGNFSRFKCAQIAIKKLRKGGLIILDNADWWVKTAEFLRVSDLIEVDMTGFSPINGYTLTTSFFFHREFNFLPKSENQPVHGVGALHQYAEE
jgi:precorrin-6B methylase 2